MVKTLIFLALLFITPLSSQELKLEAFLEAPKPWYPGQVGNFIYKISYRGQIQLVEETLPLLDLPGFEKLGDKTFDSYRQGEFSVQEITQKVRSINPGTFYTGTSILKGVHYLIRGGKKQIIPPPLESIVKPLSIVVTPFPTKGKSPFFEGAIGNFTFELSPIQQKELRVGDWFDIVITAKGDQYLDLLEAPHLMCLPGFSGFFQQAETTKAPKINYGDMTKSFHFKLAPLNALPQEIPPIIWSTFDPETNQYITWKSDPIPITIPNKVPPIQATTLENVPKERGPFAFSLLPKPTKRFTVGTHFNGLLLFMIVLVALAYFITPYIKRMLEKMRQDPLYRMRRELYQTKDSNLQMRAWDQVISDRLLEKGYLTPEGKWKDTETTENVKEFLWTLKHHRFSENKQTIENLAEQGEHFYKQVDRLPCIG